MIIWGSKWVSEHLNSGAFHCPQCQEEREYRQLSRSKKFTLYFIPLFEMEKGEKYVECSGCNKAFDSDVLEYDPKKIAAKIREDFNKLALQIIFASAGADGVIDDSEWTQVEALYKEFTDAEFNRDQLAEELEHLVPTQETVVIGARALAPSLNERGKEILVKIAIQVGDADNDFSDKEQQLMFALCDALDMPRSMLRGLLAEFGYNLGPSENQ